MLDYLKEANLINVIKTATEQAAVATYPYIGRGDKILGDQVAVNAIRSVLQGSNFNGQVIIGEGEKDKAPKLYYQEVFGDINAENFMDIAVDPIECTTYMATGLANALSVLALAPKGTMVDLQPSFYMEKLAGPKEIRGQIDINWGLKRKIGTVAECLNKPIKEVKVFVLDRTRHHNLIREIREIGAKVVQYNNGDIMGALLASTHNSHIDLLLGTGGTPEGILTACALQSFGGEFMGRLDPQSDEELSKVKNQNFDIQRWYGINELINSNDTYFAATGITDGLMLDGVVKNNNQTYSTHSIVFSKSIQARVRNTFKSLLNY